MNRGLITYQEFSLEYFIYGSGSRKFIAFPGHGRTAEDFKAFSDPLGATIYSFNLLFHGGSKAPSHAELEPLTQDTLRLLFQEMIIKFQWEEYNFIAFSEGAKYVLNFIASFPEEVNQVILMAPDGISKSIYSKTSHYSILRSWFRSIVVRPGFFLKLVSFFARIRFIHKHISKFVHQEFSTASSRMCAYLSWRYLRHLQPDKKKIQANIIKYNIDLVFIMGENDKVIPIRHAEKFIDQTKRGRLFRIKSNHHFFKSSVIQVIKKRLRILAEQESYEERKDSHSG